jgi:hypothetical protein
MNVIPGILTPPQQLQLERYGKFSNAKLKEKDVQAIRDLARAGFGNVTIAKAFGVNKYTILHIIQGKKWKWLPDVPAELPILPPDQVKTLRISNAGRLTTEQKRALAAYHKRLEETIDASADREGQAIAIINGWLGSTKRGQRVMREVIHRKGQLQ